eukprot:COSAG02_NODE_23770_length_709_cov_0.514754_2_plen_55_part_00
MPDSHTSPVVLAPVALAPVALAPVAPAPVAPAPAGAMVCTLKPPCKKHSSLSSF